MSCHKKGLSRPGTLGCPADIQDYLAKCLNFNTDKQKVSLKKITGKKRTKSRCDDKEGSINKTCQNIEETCLFVAVFSTSNSRSKIRFCVLLYCDSHYFFVKDPH